MSDANQAKRDLRKLAQGRRSKAAATAGPNCMETLSQLGMSVLADRRPGAVSGFWPIRDEIDVRPLLVALNGRGWTGALPAVMGPGEPLEFRVWLPGAPLVPAAFGLMEPPADARTLDPDVVLVPLLAFDRLGYRLGYGKGHYDRTLRLLRQRRPVLAVGVAFAPQEVQQVPVEPHDEPLDAVLTEREWIWIGRNG